MTWILNNHTGDRIEDNAEAISQSVRFRLESYRGERIAIPTYGAGLFSEIDEELNLGTAGRIASNVRRALEGLVDVERISINTANRSIRLTVSGGQEIVLHEPPDILPPLPPERDFNLFIGLPEEVPTGGGGIPEIPLEPILTSFVGYSVAQMPTRSEILAGTEGVGTRLTIPQNDQPAHIFLAYPADEGPVTSLYIYSTELPNTIDQLRAWDQYRDFVQIDQTMYDVVSSKIQLANAGGYILELIHG